MKEIWKNIKDYEDYQISNMGNCKRKNCVDSLGNLRNEKVLKKNKDIYGYCYYALCKNGKRKNFSVHRLVAKHFLENYDEKLQVNHIDGNKENNSINNIEMVSDKENKKHGWATGLYKRQYKKNSKICQYDLNGNLIKVWDNMNEIVSNTNFNKVRIYNCIKGLQIQTHNYKWSFYETNC